MDEPALSPGAIPPLPVQPLAYFPEIDFGWERVVRATLIFAGIACGTRVVSTLASAFFSAGSLTSAFFAGFGMYSVVSLPSLVTLIVCLIAIRKRTRGMRVTIVACFVLLAAANIIMVIFQVVTFYSASFGRSLPPLRRTSYLLSTTLSSLSGLIVPAMVVTLLMLPEVKRRFDRAQ